MKMLGKQLAALGLAGLLAFGAPASAVMAAESGTEASATAAESTETTEDVETEGIVENVDVVEITEAAEASEIVGSTQTAESTGATGTESTETVGIGTETEDTETVPESLSEAEREKKIEEDLLRKQLKEKQKLEEAETSETEVSNDIKTSDGVIFETRDLDDGTIEIIGYLCQNTELEIVIPSTIDGKTVTKIGDAEIGENHGFCNYMVSLYIPKEVVSIDTEAFDGCEGLETITVSPENTVYNSAGNCNAIIETATNTLIVGCKNTVIPDTVTTIGKSAFGWNDKLTSIDIPESVTTIEEDAFEFCDGLTSLYIPKGVTSIGTDVVEGCDNLTTITVASENTIYDSRDNCNAIVETATNTLIAGCKNTVIPESVTSIGGSAFSFCDGLTDMVIPEGITNIGAFAFVYCPELRNLSIPESVVNIGYHAFGGCSMLEQIVVADGNTVYDSRNHCNALIETSTGELLVGSMNTVVPAGVTRIGEEAFKYSGENSEYNYVGGLTSIDIPNGVTSIGEKAFYACHALTSVSISLSVTSIESWAFHYCDEITDVYYAGSEEQWNAIAYEDRDELKNATFHWNWSGTVCKHTATQLENVAAATCTAEGYTGDTCCVYCGKKMAAGEATAALGHDYTSAVTTEPTKSAKGVRTYTCSRCGDTYTKDIDKLPSTETTAAAYTIKFNKNASDATGSTASLKNCEVGASIKLTKNGFKRKGYTFKGWNTKKNGKGKSYKNKASVKNLTKTDGKTITLYAQWEKVKVGKVSIKSAKSSKAAQLTVKYKTVSGANGYEISYSTDKNFKKSVTKKTTTKTSYTAKKLKKGKTYYVRVRAYKKDSAGKKVYGKYSAVKKVPVKKK